MATKRSAFAQTTPVLTDDVAFIDDPAGTPADAKCGFDDILALFKPELYIAIPIAISDETTALTTGTAKLTYYMPAAFTLTGIHACVTTAPVGSSLIIDVNDGGTSIMTTNKLVIDAGENDTTTAATAPTLTDTALAAGAAITFDIDQVGSSTAGAGAKVTLLGYWT